MLFPTIGWPMINALAVNLAYLYTLPLCTFFSSLYHNVVIQSTSLQHCDTRFSVELRRAKPSGLSRIHVGRITSFTASWRVKPLALLYILTYDGISVPSIDSIS